MSKSLKRVREALLRGGADVNILEMAEGTRTASEAARAAGCDIDQIAKSIIFRGVTSGHAVLFLTAGGNTVDPARASTVAGQALQRADATFVRSETGFAIGGVAPVGHLTPPQVFHDPRLSEFAIVLAAAGTPRHIFCISPDQLFLISGSQPADFTTVSG